MSYWRLMLKKRDNTRLLLFTGSSESDVAGVRNTLIEETGCDRFIVEPDETPVPESERL